MAEILHLVARPRPAAPPADAPRRVPALRLVRAEGPDGGRAHEVAGIEAAGALPGGALERQARLLARALDAPLALVSLLDGRRQLVLAQAGLPAGWAGELPPGSTPCALTVDAGEALLLEDARRSRSARETRAVRELGAAAYAGVPLRAPDGAVVGCACAMDTRPRAWSDAEAGALECVAAGVEAELARRLAEAGRGRAERAAADREAYHGALLEHALEHALERAGAAGGGRRASPAAAPPGSAPEERLRSEAELSRAAGREELRLRFQPIVSLRTGRVAGFEALLRWEHPGRGLLAPADFLPLAEETGLIVPIGSWVLREACRSLRGWRAAFPGAPLSVSVNLSVRELRQGGLVERVRRALEETGVEPGALRLEVTEAAVAGDAPGAGAALEALRALGVHLHMDDFGTGCSSLGRLHRLPLHALKVDRSFVGGMDGGPATSRLVRAVVPVAHALGLEVVAEGVETAAALELLRGLRCEYAQGHLFSPPLDEDGVRELLAGDPRW